MNRVQDGPLPDLTLCAREPIHVPGAIQPHGALLVSSADGSVVTHASANLAAILGTVPGECLDRPLRHVLGVEACATLLGAGLVDTNTTGLTYTLARPGSAAFYLRSFRSYDSICVDIEPARPEAWQRPPLWRAQAILDSFHAANGIDELCRLAVTGLRAVTGYDRVMAYRFSADGHGEVIAEDCGALEPYLGQRYPASDIPAQARQLYLRQRVGVIVDSSYEPVPLLAATDLGKLAAIDLTHSTLRSVSPVHREFMRNMQTAASMTIGLASGGEPAAPELWGMLVCHHLTPRHASPELRALANVIGDVVSLLLHTQGTAEIYAQRARHQATLRALLGGLAASTPLLESMASMGVDLLRLVAASGAVIRFLGAERRVGKAPSQEFADAVFAALCPANHREVLAIDDLGMRHPEFAAEAAHYSGVLLLPLGEGNSGGEAPDRQDAILWFRPEQALTITWGGDPTKPLAPNPLTGTISPRSSFAAWKQIVHGHSRPWSRVDLSLAKELRDGIETEISRRTKLSLALFDRIFESSPTALVLFGREGEIKMLNREAERLFGYDRAELQLRSFALLVPERLRGAPVFDVRRYLESRGPLIRRKDGSEFPIDVALSHISPRDLRGEPMLQASIVDISLRREGERQLAQSRVDLEAINAKLTYTNQELDQFVYTASHDLRSPLRAIVSLTQFVLEDDPTLGDQTKERLGMIAGRAKRMEKLLNDVLLYARAGKGSHQGGEVTSADRLVDEVVATLQLPPGTTIVKDPSLALVEVSAAPLAQVLQNLIGNSIKHHDRESCTITLAALAQGDKLRFSVSDDGPGIAPAYRETVFNMFTTLKRRDEVEASGIGLALTRKLVTLHGGACGIESAPVRGTRVWFDWPSRNTAQGDSDAGK
jgi:PAS domain S-box-containing protein